MKHLKIWRSLLAVLGLGACSVDAPTAPRLPEAGSAGLVSELEGTLVSKDALTRKTALANDITVSAVIDKSGGTLTIPEAGFELTVPEGAVVSPTEFTVTAISGSLVAYEFGPHGLTFRVPLRAKQNLSGTNWRPLNLKTLVAGYFLERADLDESDAKALISEVIEGLTSPLSKQFNWQIQHFSGYIVAW
jgi:hypothetical protein